jgi:CRP-like cAMP-binding protein
MNAYFVPLTNNRILAALGPEGLAGLEPWLCQVELPFREVLFGPSDAVEYVYFPLAGMLSLVFTTSDGEALETGLVGREGMLPLNGFLGTTQVRYEALVQTLGAAARLPAELLRRETRQPSRLRSLLERYASAAVDQSRLAAVCNALHSVEARLARWLLMAHDRSESDVLALTQEFLGLMLGVRRESVTATQVVLQEAGVIRKPYGRIQILDRQGLEMMACECYAAMCECRDEVFETP